MDSWAPSFAEHLCKAEVKLSGTLGGMCKVTVYHEMTKDILKIISEMENSLLTTEKHLAETKNRFCNTP